MWKLESSRDRGVLVLDLSGRIGPELVVELENIFAMEDQLQGIVLDLNSVKLLDYEAVIFLERSERSGVRLVNCPPYIREWITRAKDRIEAQAEEVLLWN